MPTLGNFLGAFEPQGLIKIQAEKDASIITKGDLVALSANKWKTAPTTSSGPFGVALETKAAADTTIAIAIQGIGLVKAQGVITKNALIMCSTSVAGSVAQYVPTAVGGTGTANIYSAQQEFKLVIGRYLGHDNEGDGSTVATDAADQDTIRVWLSGGF